MQRLSRRHRTPPTPQNLGTGLRPTSPNATRHNSGHRYIVSYATPPRGAQYVRKACHGVVVVGLMLAAAAARAQQTVRLRIDGHDAGKLDATVLKQLPPQRVEAAAHGDRAELVRRGAV